MTETQTALIERIQIKESLSDAQFGDLIAASCNHEAKAAVMLAVDAVEPQTPTQVSDKLTTVTGERRPLVGHAEAYLRLSLMPAHLVQQVINDSGDTAYLKTQMGLEIADPCDGLLLDYSDRYPTIRLYEIFGSTVTHGETRAAHNRIKVLRALAGQPIQTKADAVRMTGIPANRMQEVLESLDQAGLITYESVNPHMEDTTFTVNFAEFDSSAAQPGKAEFSDELGVLLSEKKDEASGQAVVYLEEIYKHFRSKGKDSGRSTQAFRNAVRHAVRPLETKGILKRSEKPRSRDENSSSVSISNHQRLMITDLTAILDGIQALDPTTLNRGRELATEIINNPDKLRGLIDKCYGERSAQVNSLSDDALMTILNSLFTRLPDQVLTARDVVNYLRTRGYGGPRKAGPVQLKLNALSKAGKLAIDTEKGENRYRRAPDSQSQTTSTG